jgi:hypothetical protein
MRPIQQIRQLDAADPNGICVDQQTAGAAFLLINGAFSDGGVAPATLDVQRQVELESAGALSGINFTITGSDEQGREISETIAGPAAGTVATALDFLIVDSIFADAIVGTNIEIGTNALGGSIPIPIDKNVTPTSIGLALVFTAPAVNVTVQHTFDDVFATDPSTILTWFDHPTLAGETANADGNIAFPPTALRLLTNSGIGTCEFDVIQAGLAA